MAFAGRGSHTVTRGGQLVGTTHGYKVTALSRCSIIPLFRQVAGFVRSERLEFAAKLSPARCGDLHAELSRRYRIVTEGPVNQMLARCRRATTTECGDHGPGAKIPFTQLL